ncbi:hypothetical protein K458DRAFT_416483 [Lentithecium fluviatile CBS 122367]|uniref:Uncharacterized protein n=1 Tax=Lentithecium fluviatile CBS 122367 TaxID=1168545 RepID=A0A6G1J6L6_9PLEO|nr:hypothetical protein K458DRAFT_416483 [Lentithecium fluviatile CBS 122367]
MLSTILSTLLLLTSTLAIAIPQPSPPNLSLTARAVDPTLVPSFGIQRGIKINGTADCAGLNGKAIPCQCPPKRSAFLAKLNEFVDQGNALGVPISFPEGNGEQSAQERKRAFIVTLQNLEGKGKGCPLVSTTFGSL